MKLFGKKEVVKAVKCDRKPFATTWKAVAKDFLVEEVFAYDKNQKQLYGFKDYPENQYFKSVFFEHVADFTPILVAYIQLCHYQLCYSKLPIKVVHTYNAF